MNTNLAFNKVDLNDALFLKGSDEAPDFFAKLYWQEAEGIKSLGTRFSKDGQSSAESSQL